MLHSTSLPLSQKLFSRTFRHPVVGHHAQWVPLSWLLALSNPNPTNTTNLADGDNQTQVSMDVLYADLLEKGMRDPFLVGVGRVTRRVRLEAGNHRVRVFLEKGHLLAPAVAYVGDSAISQIGNGRHEGELMDLRLDASPDIMEPYPVKEYMRLSDALVLNGSPDSLAARHDVFRLLQAQHPR